jgi:hypothetical protein
LLEMVKSSPVDIVYTLDQNEFNGQVNVQLKLLDIRPSVV